MSAIPEAVPDARSRILDAAAEAFMRSGFAGTTIDDIAAEVGATKGLVYYHFRSKFDIFLAIYEEGMHLLHAYVQPHATGPGSGGERLVAMSVAHVVNLMEHLAEHHVVHQAVRGEVSPALKARQRDQLTELSQLRGDYELMFRAVFAAGIADGSLRPVDPGLATRTLLSSLNAVDVWFRPRPEQSAEELHTLAHDVVDLLTGGLVAAGGTTR